MPKVKVPRKSTSIDMTAMCDVSFLLLTFFMLTSKFRPPEAVPIDLPSSKSQAKIENALTISIGKDGKAFIGLTTMSDRQALLEKMLDKHPEIKLSNNQKAAFRGLDMFGFSLAEMPAVLNLNPEQFKRYKQNGIPKDSANCELGEWVLRMRMINPDINISIKGDKTTNIKAFKEVVTALTEKALKNRFSLITTLSGSSQRETVTTEENN